MTPQQIATFRLSTQYQRATKSLMKLIVAASDSLEDSRWIAHALYDFCIHQNEKQLNWSLRGLRYKYSRAYLESH